MNDRIQSLVHSQNRRGWAVAFSGLGVNLALGVLYSWGVFASALRESGWSATQSQIPYMIACAVFALLMVPGGRIQDRLGPKLVLLLAALLTGVGFILSGRFLSVAGLSIFFGVVFGTAMGFGYSTTTPAAIKWFSPRRRGLISGIVVSGFGLAGIYVAPLTHYLIDRFGLSRTFYVLGLFFSIAILGFRLVIKNPPEGYKPPVVANSHSRRSAKKHAANLAELSPARAAESTALETSWRGMIRTPQFYLLWSMFLVGTFSGLLILGQLSNIGQEQAGLNPNEATIFVVIYAMFNWFGRIMTGLISDRIGRKSTLFIIFMLQVISFVFFNHLNSVTTLAIGTAFVAFSFGGMLTSFPAATADYYGVKNLGLNYGLVFTAWGVGGVFGPFLGGVVHDATGDYHVSYLVSAALCLIGAIMSLLIRHPARSKYPDLSGAH